jgi:hypothetical protein
MVRVTGLPPALIVDEEKATLAQGFGVIQVIKRLVAPLKPLMPAAAI